MSYKLLFCGYEFPTGYELTKIALQNHENIIVNQCKREDICNAIIDAYVIVPLMTKITSKEIELAKELKMIMQYGVGLEGIDIDYATKSNIKVCKIESEGTGNAQSCAEHSIFLMLSLLRNINEVKNALLTSRLGYPMGKTLYNSITIIFGYGGIGKQLLKRLQSFELQKIIVITRNIKDISSIDDLSIKSSSSSFQPLSDKSDVFIKSSESIRNNSNIIYITTEEFYNGVYNDIIKGADSLFLCCSQNKDNIGMVNENFLSLLKSGIFIVNVARGGLLNYDDVLKGLNNKTIGGLGLDVFHTEPFPIDYNEILQHSSVVVTPHIAGVTQISYENMAQCVAKNVLQLINNNPIVGCVNII